MYLLIGCFEILTLINSLVCYTVPTQLTRTVFPRKVVLQEKVYVEYSFVYFFLWNSYVCTVKQLSYCSHYDINAKITTGQWGCTFECCLWRGKMVWSSHSHTQRVANIGTVQPLERSETRECLKIFPFYSHVFLNFQFSRGYVNRSPP